MSSDLRRKLMAVLDKMFEHKSENNLADDTAYSVPRSEFSMIAPESAAEKCAVITEILRDGHIINLYGPYAVTVSRDSEGQQVFVFVRVPDHQDIVAVEKL